MLTEVIEIRTTRRTEFIDITSEVEEIVKRAGIVEGSVLIYSKHTTTAIAINEAETGLLDDYIALLESLIPEGKGYRHDRIDNNAHSHLRALLIGNEKNIPVINGSPALGTWQRIFLVELDGPRLRRVVVQVR